MPDVGRESVNRRLTEAEARRATGLLCTYYADQLAQIIRASADMQQKVIDAAHALRDFTQTSKITSQEDAERIAAWAQRRTAESPQDGNPRGTVRATVSSFSDRLLIMKWLSEGGYDIQPTPAPEPED